MNTLTLAVISLLLWQSTSECQSVQVVGWQVALTSGASVGMTQQRAELATCLSTIVVGDQVMAVPVVAEAAAWALRLDARRCATRQVDNLFRRWPRPSNMPLHTRR